MAKQITMPRVAPAMESGTIIRLLKHNGDTIAKGEPFAEVESEKAVFALESLYDGIIAELLCREGETFGIGSPLAVVLEPGENAAPDASPGPAQALAEEPAPRLPGMVRATPLAKKMAQEHQLDLRLIVGSGPNGRVEKGDILAFLAIREELTAVAEPAAIVEPAPTTAIAPAEKIAFMGVRKTAAQHLIKSKENVVPVTSTTEIDVSELMALYQKMKTAWLEEDGLRLTLNAFILRAVAVALRANPLLNAQLSDTDILLHQDINVNLAMNVEDMLYTPVIRNADRLSVRQLAVEIAALLAKIQQKSITIEEMTGGTFTLTNVGPFDVQVTTPVVNYPQVGILAIGKVNLRPMYNEAGDIVPRSLCYISLTYDHRVIGGVDAARFRAKIKELLENPYLLLS